MSAPTLHPPSPVADCYYVLDGAYHGPVTGTELEALHAAGTLPVTAQVRTPLGPGWQSYGDWQTRRTRSAQPDTSATTTSAEAAGAKQAAQATADAGPRHTCPVCRKEWPESLMMMNDRRWLCRACFYGLAMNAKRQRDKVRRDWWRWLRERWKPAVTLATGLTVAGFLAWHYRHELPFDFFDDEEPAESWARLPPAQWPSLVFTNQAEFYRHSSLRGQGVFFARRGDGTVLAATAAHVITTDAGVVPDMAPSELESSLRAWWAYPPGEPKRAVAIAGLYGSPAALHGYDMLFLRVAPNADTSAITPLRLARHEARAGEKVFVVAPLAAVDPKAAGARQAIFPGSIHIKDSGGGHNAKTPARDGTLLDLNMDPMLLPKDLGGTPVIDERGHLVGLVKGWGDPQDAAGHVNTVVAQGAMAFRDLLEPKKDPKTGQAPEELRAGAAKVEKAVKNLLTK